MITKAVLFVHVFPKAARFEPIISKTALFSNVNNDAQLLHVILKADLIGYIIAEATLYSFGKINADNAHQALKFSPCPTSHLRECPPPL